MPICIEGNQEYTGKNGPKIKKKKRPLPENCRKKPWFGSHSNLILTVLDFLKIQADCLPISSRFLLVVGKLQEKARDEVDNSVVSDLIPTSS